LPRALSRGQSAATKAISRPVWFLRKRPDLISINTRFDEKGHRELSPAAAFFFFGRRLVFEVDERVGR